MQRTLSLLCLVWLACCGGKQVGNPDSKSDETQNMDGEPSDHGDHAKVIVVDGRSFTVPEYCCDPSPQFNDSCDMRPGGKRGPSGTCLQDFDGPAPTGYKLEIDSDGCPVWQGGHRGSVICGQPPPRDAAADVEGVQSNDPLCPANWSGAEKLCAEYTVCPKRELDCHYGYGSPSLLRCENSIDAGAPYWICAH